MATILEMIFDAVLLLASLILTTLAPPTLRNSFVSLWLFLLIPFIILELVAPFVHISHFCHGQAGASHLPVILHGLTFSRLQVWVRFWVVLWFPWPLNNEEDISLETVSPHVAPPISFSNPPPKTYCVTSGPTSDGNPNPLMASSHISPPTASAKNESLRPEVEKHPVDSDGMPYASGLPHFVSVTEKREDKKRTAQIKENNILADSAFSHSASLKNHKLKREPRKLLVPAAALPRDPYMTRPIKQPKASLILAATLRECVPPVKYCHIPATSKPIPGPYSGFGNRRTKQPATRARKLRQNPLKEDRASLLLERPYDTSAPPVIAPAEDTVKAIPKAYARWSFTPLLIPKPTQLAAPQRPSLATLETLTTSPVPQCFSPIPSPAPVSPCTSPSEILNPFANTASTSEESERLDAAAAPLVLVDHPSTLTTDHDHEMVNAPVVIDRQPVHMLTPIFLPVAQLYIDVDKEIYEGTTIFNTSSQPSSWQGDPEAIQTPHHPQLQATESHNIPPSTDTIYDTDMAPSQAEIVIHPNDHQISSPVISPAFFAPLVPSVSFSFQSSTPMAVQDTTFLSENRHVSPSTARFHSSACHACRGQSTNVKRRTARKAVRKVNPEAVDFLAAAMTQEAQCSPSSSTAPPQTRHDWFVDYAIASTLDGENQEQWEEGAYSDSDSDLEYVEPDYGLAATRSLTPELSRSITTTPTNSAPVTPLRSCDGLVSVDTQGDGKEKEVPLVTGANSVPHATTWLPTFPIRKPLVIPATKPIIANIPGPYVPSLHSLLTPKSSPYSSLSGALGVYDPHPPSTLGLVNNVMTATKPPSHSSVAATPTSNLASAAQCLTSPFSVALTKPSLKTSPISSMRTSSPEPEPDVPDLFVHPVPHTKPPFVPTASPTVVTQVPVGSTVYTYSAPRLSEENVVASEAKAIAASLTPSRQSSINSTVSMSSIPSRQSSIYSNVSMSRIPSRQSSINSNISMSSIPSAPRMSRENTLVISQVKIWPAFFDEDCIADETFMDVDDPNTMYNTRATIHWQPQSSFLWQWGPPEQQDWYKNYTATKNCDSDIEMDICN